MALTWLAISVACGPPGEPKGELKRPDWIVLISVDTLRADAVSWGQSSWSQANPKSTPFLAELADGAARFDRAYAPSSWTAPSIASAFTGLQPSSHGVIGGRFVPGLGVLDQPVLAESLTTLAELLAPTGYRGIAIAANHHLGADLGFAQGFEHYAPSDFRLADQVRTEALRRLEERLGDPEGWREQKIFLWLHFFDPHDPYLDRGADPAPLATVEPNPANRTIVDLRRHFPEVTEPLKEALRALYLSEIRYFDEQLRQLFAELQAPEDTLLIFLSDHGEEIGERGALGHGHTLFEEVVRVPMFLRWPGHIVPGPIDDPVQLADLVPTLASLLDLEAPTHLDGHDLSTRLTGGEPTSRSIPLELGVPPALGLIVGTEKLLVPTVGSPQLFDLAADPGEHHDLASQHPERVRELARQLAALRRAMPAPPEDLSFYRQDDPEVLEQLRALGYVQ